MEVEAKVAVEELVEVEEKPPHTQDDNITDASESQKNDIVSLITSLYVCVCVYFAQFPIT